MSRQLPRSLDAEKALLGAMILYPQTVKVVIESGILEEDFFQDEHRRIFKAIESIHDSGRVVDAAILMSKLSENNEISMVGGNEYILDLIDTSTTPTNVKHYSDIVRNKSLLRKLVEVSQSISEDILSESKDIDEVFDNAEKLVLGVTQSRLTTDFRSSKEVIQEVIRNINVAMKSENRIVGKKTGFRDLDAKTNGFSEGDLVILAARPSMGKTALALNIAKNIAKINKEPVAIFSLEMPAEQLMKRILSSLSTVDGQKINSAYLTQAEFNRVKEIAKTSEDLGLYIDDSSTIKMSEIFSKCRKLKNEKGLGAIVIDYIQLISGGKKTENRQQEVSEISRNLKALARELKVPVIALSQLSRSVEQRKDNRPMLSDLRESGAIEQDADIVMFIYRKEYYGNSSEGDEGAAPVRNDGPQEAEVIIAKHRNGPTGVVKLVFTPAHNSFDNVLPERG